MARGAVVCGVLLAAFWSGSAIGQEPSRLDVAEGACPFECCTYGRWAATRSVHLLTVPRASAGVVATVSPGDSVTAETGEVHTRAAPFVFGADRDGFAKGDTVWVLDYQGEGRFRVRYRGSTVPADLGFSPYGARGRSMLEEYRSVWWVRIKLDNGVVGWTAYPEAFAGRDACSSE